MGSEMCIRDSAHSPSLILALALALTPPLSPLARSLSLIPCVSFWMRAWCESLAVSCLEGSEPPVGVLSRPHSVASRLHQGGYGVGVPSGWISRPQGVTSQLTYGVRRSSALGLARWVLRPSDFCREDVPPQIGRRRSRRGAPRREECFCPTHSFWARSNDTKGFGRRAPIGSLPGLPAVPADRPNAASCAGESFIVFALSLIHI